MIPVRENSEVVLIYPDIYIYIYIYIYKIYPAKLVNITPITMVYGTQITIVTGAFVNQLTSLGGLTLYIYIYINNHSHGGPISHLMGISFGVMPNESNAPSCTTAMARLWPSNSYSWLTDFPSDNQLVAGVISCHL